MDTQYRAGEFRDRIERRPRRFTMRLMSRVLQVMDDEVADVAIVFDDKDVGHSKKVNR